MKNKSILIGGIIGLVIGILIDFTPFVLFTMVWMNIFGDTTLARYISWITFPILGLIIGLIIGLKIKKKGK